MTLQAYLVSCVNSRVGDIAAAAAVVRGQKVAEVRTVVTSPVALHTARRRNTLLNAGTVR